MSGDYYSPALQMATDEGKDRTAENRVRDLVEENERLRRRLSLLSQLSRHISSNLDPRTILRDIVESACQLTSARYGALGIFDKSGRISEFVTHSVTAEERERIGPPPQGLGILGLLEHTQRPLRLADLSRHPRSVGFPPGHPPMKTFLGAPIRYRDEHLGNLYLTEKAEGQEFTAEDEDLLVLFAAQAGAAVHNAQLYQEVQQHAAQMGQFAREVELVHAVTRLAVSTLDMDEVLQRTLPVVLQGTGADAAEIWVLDSQTGVLELKAQRSGPDGQFFERQAFKLGEGLPGLAAQSLEPVICLDIASDPRFLRGRLVKAGFRAFRAFPITFQGRPLGALCVACRDPLRLGERHNRLLARMADELAIAIQNAQLFRREQEARAAAEAAQRALSESEARFRLLAENAQDVIYRYRLSTAPGFEYISPSAIAVTGYTPEEFYADPGLITRMVHPEDRPLLEALVSAPSPSGQSVVLRWEHKDGRTVWTEQRIVPILDEAGALVAMEAIVRDITERKRAEEELEALRRDFLGMVSHDLKSPLAAIKSIASSALMEQGPRDSDTLLQCLRSIDEETDRMTELVGNLLDMSRIEAGAMPLDPEECHLADIVSESVRHMERSRAGGRHRVNIQVPLELPQVYADFDQMVRVVTNLLSNAIKYSPEGSEIWVRSYLDSRSAAVIVTEVQDQGIGIPENEIGKLFTKFYRVTTRQGRGRPGSGLGLAICKAIVEAHGGRIWVQSQPGKGSTFYFSLPASLPGAGGQARGPLASPMS